MAYRRRRKLKMRYVVQWVFIWIVFALLGFFALPYAYEFEDVVRVLIALNVSTVLVMGFDKLASTVRFHRVPEIAFYLMTLLGGSIGMLIGMYAFRHKTRKQSFQIVVGLLILVQLSLVYYFWYM